MPKNDELDAKRDLPVERQQPRKIGFVGLGRMGTAMAANLAADGRNVCAYVRRPERVEDLGRLGVAATTRLPDLFDSDIIVTMLPMTPPCAVSSLGHPESPTACDPACFICR